MKNLIKSVVILAILGMMLGCEEEVPDYAADIVGKYIVESVYSSFWDETIDLTSLPLEDALIVEITRGELRTYENDENRCQNTYSTETDAIDGVSETSILFTDDTELAYSMVGSKLRIEDDGDIMMLATYSGDIPPASWTDPTLLTNDTYEPNNVITMATAIAAGGTTQNHYLGNCEDKDYFIFSAVSGTSYKIATSTPEGSNLDLTLTLSSGAGVELGYNDDYAFPDLNPGLDWTWEVSGDYYFLIDGFWDDEAGNYSVSVNISTTLQRTSSAPEEKKHRKVEKIRLGDLLFN